MIIIPSSFDIPKYHQIHPDSPSDIPKQHHILQTPLFIQPACFCAGCSKWHFCSTSPINTNSGAQVKTDFRRKMGRCGPWKFRGRAQIALLGPQGPRRGPIPGQSVWWAWVQPRRTNRGQSGPNLVPRGPPRTSEDPKRGISGQNGPRRGLIPGQSVWWPWVQPKQANGGQLGPNLVHRGPPRTSEVPERTFYGQNGPFLPLFDRFLKLGGSIGTITVLDEQSIPLRCSGHPTSLYFEKKFPHKIGPWKFRVNGHFGPNGALLGPPGAQERPDTRSKC